MTDDKVLTMADGPSIEVSLVIDAAAAELWPLLTDIGLPARFSDEFQQAEWLDGATDAVLGARFQGTNENKYIGRWQVTCTVVECVPERAFAWAVGDTDAPSASWRFTLEPVDGGTRLSQSARLGPGPSGLTEAIERKPDREHDIIAGRLNALSENMRANLDGIAEIVG